MDVANEILDAIEIIVDKQTKEQTTQIYPGICKSVSGNSCVMSINGRDNTVQFYGSTPTVGTIYRVFVPNGNMSMAFIITTNGGGSSAFGVSSVNGLTGDVNLTASDVGAAPKPKLLSVSLKASGWNSSAKTQTVTVSGVLADETKQLITPTPAIASQEAYYNAGIRCTGQSADKLTFTAKTIPTADLTVYVTIQEVGA